MLIFVFKIANCCFFFIQIRKSGQYNVSAVLKGSQFMVTSPLKALSDDDVIASYKAKDDEDEGIDDDNEKEMNGIGECVEIHPGAELVADFLVGQLQKSSTVTSANKQILHMLVFSRQVIMSVPKHKLQVSLLIFLKKKKKKKKKKILKNKVPQKKKVY